MSVLRVQTLQSTMPEIRDWLSIAYANLIKHLVKDALNEYENGTKHDSCLPEILPMEIRNIAKLKLFLIEFNLKSWHVFLATAKI